MDKLDSIPGFKTLLPTRRIVRIVQKVGCVICGQTDRMVPADKKLYALRDATGSVPSIPLITASILSNTFFDIERSSARANRLNSYNHHVGDPNWLEKDLARTTTATPESVANAARSWLKESDRVVTLVSAKKGAPIAGKVVNVKRGGK